MPHLPTRWSPALAALAVVAACSDDPADSARCAAPCPPLSAAAQLNLSQGGVSSHWQAWALVDGVWQQGEVVPSPRPACGCGGEVRLRARLKLSQAATVSRMELRGTLDDFPATQWWSQGFQSWSQSGALALGGAPNPADVEKALAKQGDLEVVRGGQELSWFGTVVGGGQRQGQPLGAVAMAMTAERWRPWAQAWQSAGGVELRLVSGGAGEQVSFQPGETAEGEVFWLEMGADTAGALRRFGQALPRRVAPAEIGWNSWYQLWDKVDAPAFASNVAQAQALLAPAAQQLAKPLRMVLDDGWQQAWGDWRPNSKFPLGLAAVAKDVQAHGAQMGLWLAPLLVDADLPLVKEHPDWLVAGASYSHLVHGEMRVLDVTHPQAKAHLQQQLQALTAAGIGLLKIDFLFAGTWEGKRHQAVTGMQAYALALQAIRQAVGDQTLLLAVGAPPLPTLGRVDAWRFGPDIAVEPFGAVWHFLPGELRTLAMRWPYCYAVQCDADPALLRDLAPHEVGFGAWTVAAAGGGWWLSDDLRTLDPARKSLGATADWLQVATQGLPAQPEPLWLAEPPTRLTSALFDHLEQQSRHAVPPRWRLGDGRVLLLNASDAAVQIDGTSVPGRSAQLRAP